MNRLLLLALSACAAHPPEQCPAVPSGPGMSLREAQGIVQVFESKHLRPGDDSLLRKPKSLDEVIDILHSDELDLFPGAVAFAQAQDGAEAQALAAQLEIAWGEAEWTLA